MAGLALARTNSADRVRRELAPVGHLLIPVFFLQIGIDVDIEAFTDGKVLWIAAVLLLVAVVGKLVAAGGHARPAGDKLLVGIGMIPRGEVGLIFATLGLREGVFGQDVYGALILVVLLTTVLTPPALRWRLLRMRAARRARPVITGAPSDALVAVDARGRVAIAGRADAVTSARGRARRPRALPRRTRRATVSWSGSMRSRPGRGRGTNMRGPSSGVCSRRAGRGHGDC